MPHTYTTNDCCDFCKVKHEQVRSFRRVVCAKTNRFITVWQDADGCLHCAKTGKCISQTYIKTESRASYYRWSERKAELRLIDCKDGIKTACEHCHSRERKAGNCYSKTRTKTKTNHHQPVAENAIQAQLFT